MKLLQESFDLNLFKSFNIFGKKICLLEFTSNVKNFQELIILILIYSQNYNVRGPLWDLQSFKKIKFSVVIKFILNEFFLNLTQNSFSKTFKTNTYSKNIYFISEFEVYSTASKYIPPKDLN